MASAGTLVLAATSGADLAVPFGLGGALGTCYQWLLQQGVDTLGPTSPVVPASMNNGASFSGQKAADPFRSSPQGDGGQQSAAPSWQRTLGSQSFRLLLVGAVALAAVVNAGDKPIEAPQEPSALESRAAERSGGDSVDQQRRGRQQEGDSKWSRVESRHLLAGLSGFLTFKVAVVAAAAAPKLSDSSPVSIGVREKEKSDSNK